MKINIQDSNFIISYIQMFLKEYSGINIKKISGAKSKGIYTKDSYIISMSNPLRVTGIYNMDTYMAVSLYMAFNYPNEQFPFIWSYDSENQQWNNIPCEQDKLILTMDKLIKACCDRAMDPTIDIENKWVINESVLVESREEGQPENIIIYNEICNGSSYLSWSDLLKYFSSKGLADDLYKFLTDKIAQYRNNTTEVPSTGLFDKKDLNDRLITIIVNNTVIGSSHKEVVQLNERILAYFFGEVVSPLSSKEEIHRIQKMMYSKVPLSRIGKFDDEMLEDIKKYQKDFLVNTVVYPTSYQDFKVTGYVDPWTERVIRERGVL